VAVVIVVVLVLVLVVVFAVAVLVASMECAGAHRFLTSILVAGGRVSSSTCKCEKDKAERSNSSQCRKGTSDKKIKSERESG
jgi:hypothetical protein